MRGLVAAFGVLTLAACGSSPVLLEKSDFTGVQAEQQNEEAYAPGWTWCDALRPSFYIDGGAVSSSLTFGDRERAAATIIDGSTDDLPADYMLEQYEAQADSCARSDATTRGYSIEPLGGLAEGEVGWTTRTSDGEWGEYVLIPLDEWRLLAVGFSTSEDEPPVEMDRLVELARQGAEQFPSDRG
ncbi:hypothetical protein [Cellulomonas endometrii]|uniref:hypothetical protein n=1 Tax=Cellulomonas endometrii TaxID=3036301 RepID=UPI0024ADF449|nr:hypothetical protein [Cellulomonas endometrii]